MARKPRIHFPGALYHVMLRGNNKKEIFFSDENKKYFYHLLDEGIKRFGYRIHAHCLMSNHVHLAIQAGDVSLSKIMHNVSFRYTQYINHVDNRVGHIFQGRFKAILVDSDKYFIELIRYIHLNPVRAKIVDALNDYIWSSHRAYLDLDEIFWLTKEYALSHFGNQYPSAVTQYLRFMQVDTSLELQNKFQCGSQKKFSVLGNDEFLSKINLIKNTRILNLTLDNIINMICSHYSVDSDQLRTNSKRQKYVKVRSIIACLAKEFQITTYKQIADYFMRDATGLARSVRTLECSLSGREELVCCRKLIEMSVCQA